MSTSNRISSSAPTAVSPRRLRHHARGFWIVAVLFAMTMAFASAPAPLYVIYQQEQGFSALAVTVIFGVYTAGVAVSLYLVGHLSDRFGRRRVVIPAVLLNVLAALIFLTWHEFGWLLVARFITGLGVGMLTATATAHITELRSISRPDASPQFATAVGTAANIGGIGLGPLISGIIADHAATPLFAPYMTFGLLMVLGLIGATFVPETIAAPAAAHWRYRPQRVAVPQEARGRFWAAGAGAFVSFAMFGFFTSLAPSFISGTLHQSSHTVAGLIAFLVFGSAALAQIATTRLKPARLFTFGSLVLLPVGLVLVVAAILSSSFALLVIGGVVVGAGSGMAFRAAVTSVIEIAAADSRSEALAGLFLIGYVGMSVPVVLLGILLQFAPLPPSIITFGALMLVLIVLSALLNARRRRPAGGSRAEMSAGGPEP